MAGCASTAGYLLVGGRSSRMGRDKALLPFHGVALAQAIGGTVRAAAGSCVLVGDPSTYAGLGLSVIPDLYPGEGPLGGILTALYHTAADWNVIVACDMPEVSAGFLERLLGCASQSFQDVLAPASCCGRLEPLCSVYHRRSAWALGAAFARGARKVADALAEVRLATLTVPDVRIFENVNTPRDWAPYAG